MPNTISAASVIKLRYQRNKYCVFCSPSPRRKRLLQNPPSLEKDSTAAESSVTFLKLEILFNEYLSGVCPGKGMRSITVVTPDVEHDLINEFLL